MKPVDQTAFGVDEGNCFAACLASLLELPIERVEIGASTHPDWVRPMQDWLAGQGLCFVEFPLKGTPYFWMPQPFCVISGPSPRLPAPYQHAVVGRMNGYVPEIVHDPHPSRAGVTEMESVGFLVPLDPAAWRLL